MVSTDGLVLARPVSRRWRRSITKHGVTYSSYGVSSCRATVASWVPTCSRNRGPSHRGTKQSRGGCCRRLSHVALRPPPRWEGSSDWLPAPPAPPHAAVLRKEASPRTRGQRIPRVRRVRQQRESEHPAARVQPHGAGWAPHEVHGYPTSIRAVNPEAGRLQLDGQVSQDALGSVSSKDSNPRVTGQLFPERQSRLGTRIVKERLTDPRSRV